MPPLITTRSSITRTDWTFLKEVEAYQKKKTSGQKPKRSAQSSRDEAAEKWKRVQASSFFVVVVLVVVIMYKSVLLLYRYFFIWPGHAGERLAHGHARLFCRNRFGKKKKKLLPRCVELRRRRRRRRKRKKMIHQRLRLKIKGEKNKTQKIGLHNNSIWEWRRKWTKKKRKKKLFFLFNQGLVFSFVTWNVTRTKELCFSTYFFFFWVRSLSLSHSRRVKRRLYLSYKVCKATRK